MKYSELLKANLRRHRGGLMGIFILVFLASLSLTAVLTIWQNSNHYLEEELIRAGYGDMTAWVSGLEDSAPLANEIRTLDSVSQVESQPVIYTEYTLNGQESDSEGQLILYAPAENRYRFFMNDLSGYQEQPDAIAPGEVYLSPSLISMMDAKLGDKITFPIARGSRNLTLTVAGWYEDPFMGSSMIGMKGFLIGESDREQVLAILQNAGIDALARDGVMLHIFSADRGSTFSELSAQINESTSLPAYIEFSHSASAIFGFMLVLQNAFSGFLLAFAVVLLLAVLVVLGHQIQSAIQQDTRNMGILKTIGFTNQGLCTLQLVQYLSAILPGMILGLLLSGPVGSLAAATTITTTGILVPSALPVGLCLLVLGLVLAALTGFILWKLQKISKITPMGAIRGETESSHITAKKLPPIQGGNLYVSLALRQLLTGRKRYLGACLVAVLLAFFASLVGRMDLWLGPDGKGMMDAFNPADHDIGVQSFGELTPEEFEKTIRSYSQITDSYLLAMPSVAVNGVDMTANVIDQPDRFHLLEGRAPTADNEVAVTEFVAADLGLAVGDSLTIGADSSSGEYTISGIYSCANDMGQNIGMSREGYLKIGSDSPNLWCWHYFLDDPSQKAPIIQALENAYGGDIHVHENTWPGLSGIISAMGALVIFQYGMVTLFVLVVTVMTGSRLLLAEQRDLSIYKAMGFTSGRLRLTFALRFGMAAAVGVLVGILLAAAFADLLISAAMSLAGISNFSSNPNLVEALFPGGVITLLYLVFGWLSSARIQKLDLTLLAAD